MLVSSHYKLFDFYLASNACLLLTRGIPFIKTTADVCAFPCRFYVISVCSQLLADLELVFSSCLCENGISANTLWYSHKSAYYRDDFS